MSPLILDTNPTLVSPFRQYIPPKGHPKTRGLDRADPYVYSRGIVERPGPKEFIEKWTAPLKKPFYGITNDGTRREDLYTLCDEGAPTKEMVAAAQLILDSLNDEERKKVMYDIDSEEWRKWCNPEFIIHDVGVRLEHLQQPQIDSIINLLKQSLSESGFEKVEAARKTNHFLGEICNSQAVLNQNSYFFMLFGTPSKDDPWGYTFFGHHLCLNVFITGQQMTIGPVFIGAEPNIIDAGPDKGTRLCTQEATLGLRLMQSLSPELQRTAQLYTQMHDAAMPPGRWNPHDERHQAGAFRDNIIMPPTGIRATSLTKPQQHLLLQILETYSSLLPPGPLAHRLHLIASHLPDTFFSWIGGYGNANDNNNNNNDDENAVFYYCIQSPVVLVEFDCHAGKFLVNDRPARFHVHSILRLPNGGDYGRAVIDLSRRRLDEGEGDIVVSSVGKV